MDHPKVGIGVIIINKQEDILVGKRKGDHAPFFSIPGGHLEVGETFEEAACREVFEETGLQIHNPEVIGITNNLMTYAADQKHTVSVILLAENYEGIVLAKELDKCEDWNWVKPAALPMPHFEASMLAVECFLKKKFYLKNNRADEPGRSVE